MYKGINLTLDSYKCMHLYVTLYSGAFTTQPLHTITMAMLKQEGPSRKVKVMFQKAVASPERGDSEPPKYYNSL